MEEGPTHKNIVPDPVNFSDDPDQSEMRHVSLKIKALAMQIVMSSLDCVTVGSGTKTNTHPSPNVTMPLGLLWQQLIRVCRLWGQCYYGMSEVGGEVSSSSHALHLFINFPWRIE